MWMRRETGHSRLPMAHSIPPVIGDQKIGAQPPQCENAVAPGMKRPPFSGPAHAADPEAPKNMENVLTKPGGRHVAAAVIKLSLS
jgi:hypothetical protein